MNWAILSALFDQAEALEGQALESFLAALPDDQQAFIPALRRMLQADDQAERLGFLSTPPPVYETEPRPDGLWLSGARIGPYRLLTQVGTGGMAEVWHAERCDGSFERTVAMKLLYVHASAARREAFVGRFTRERDILASLSHPNVAGLHDAGVTDSGQAWLALDYVDGRPITQWCDQRRLSVADRIGTFRQVLSAVAHAHANLIIHRDLKPSNILVDESGMVTLLDFGIAKMLETHSAELVETELTLHGGRPLTPQYASPEQLLGRPLSTATDIYSLGVVLHQLLTGQLPRPADPSAPVGVSAAALDRDVLTPSRCAISEQAASERSSDVARLRRTLRPDLDAILLKALEPAPARRYDTVAALQGELDRWLKHEPVMATVPGPAYRARKFVRRNPKSVLAGAVSIVAVIGASVAVALAGIQAKQEAQRAAKVKDFLLEMFNLSDPDQSQGTDIKASAVVAAGVERADRMLGDEPLLQAEVLRSIGHIQQNTGHYSEAELLFERVVAIYSSLGRQRERTDLILVLADNEMQLGDAGAVRRQLEKAKPFLMSAPGDADLQMRAGSLRGLLLRLEGKMAEADRETSAAVEIGKRAFGPGDVRLLDILSDLSLIKLSLNDYAGARTVLAEQRLIVAGLGKGRKVTQSVGLDFQAAYIEVVAGDYRQAETLAVAAKEHCDPTLGRDSEDCLIIRFALVHALSYQGDHLRCLEYLPDLMHATTNDQSPRRRDEAVTEAAYLLARLGRMNEYPTIRRQLAAISTAPADQVTLDPVNTPVPRVMATIALLDGNVPEVERWLGALPKEAPPSTVGQKSTKTSTGTLLLQGLALQARFNDALALAYLQSAASTAATALGERHPLVYLYRLNQLRSLVRLGRLAEANALVANSIPVLSASMRPDAGVLQQIGRLAREGLTAQTDASTVPTLFF